MLQRPSLDYKSTVTKFTAFKNRILSSQVALTLTHRPKMTSSETSVIHRDASVDQDVPKTIFIIGLGMVGIGQLEREA